MMTREEILKAMKGQELIKEADRLGVKAKCDKTRVKLTEAKTALIDRILAFEAGQTKKVEEINTNENSIPTPKRGALIEWNGKAQNICAWGEELDISANTLYGRIYKLGWTIEKAFTTKGRKNLPL